MELTLLTYTSLSRLDPQATTDIEGICHAAAPRNEANGITSMLVFNGTHFLQILEGTHRAIDELMGRLRRDPRHSGLEVRDERKISGRCFPGWPMELVRVKPGYFEAREELAGRLPETVAEEIQLRLFRMTELISTMAFD